jgi:hypothetical protein
MNRTHCFVICVILTTIASAKADLAKSKPFEKGTFSLELESSYTTPIRFSTDEFVTGTAGVGYYLFDNWSVSLLGHIAHVNQDFDNDADGGGGSLLVRWHLFNFDRFSVYADGGGGLAWFDTDVPTFGTTYNYTARAGGGLAWRLKDDVYLLGGARYFHLSNGNQHGRPKNPSYDGVEWYLGVMFTFR